MSQFKVLITSFADGAGVHSLVVDFLTPEQANEAVEKINADSKVGLLGGFVRQFARRLS